MKTVGDHHGNIFKFHFELKLRTRVHHRRQIFSRKRAPHLSKSVNRDESRKPFANGFESIFSLVMS